MLSAFCLSLVCGVLIASGHVDKSVRKPGVQGPARPWHAGPARAQPPQGPSAGAASDPSGGSSTRPVADASSSSSSGSAPRRPLAVYGQGKGLLAPSGALVPVDLRFGNPNGTAVTVTSATVSIASVSKAGCSLDNFAVARQLQATPRLPALSELSLSDLGVPRALWPQLTMLERGNQDACQGSTVGLRFTATARTG